MATAQHTLGINAIGKGCVFPPFSLLPNNTRIRWKCTTCVYLANSFVTVFLFILTRELRTVFAFAMIT